jgi:hypothetical protein
MVYFRLLERMAAAGGSLMTCGKLLTCLLAKCVYKQQSNFKVLNPQTQGI